MTRSMSPTVSLPQRLAACALLVAGALCLFVTGEGLRLHSQAMEQLTGGGSIDEASAAATPAPASVTAMQALDNARVNLAKANDAFARSSADEAAQFALNAQDDLRLARSRPGAKALIEALAEVEAGLQSLRQQGLSREQARRGAPPVFDFFRGFRDWGNPDSAPAEDADSAPSAHPLGPAQPLASGRHIMASSTVVHEADRSRIETERA